VGTAIGPAFVDFHVHASPSLIPRHSSDAEAVARHLALGAKQVVLKAHEGSTAERAATAGAIGGIVLNSPVGGANPSAVEVAARLGGRVVWMPTVSAPAHQAAKADPQLSVHADMRFLPVPVLADGHVRPEWRDVLSLCVEHDLVLASGHLSASETLAVFTLARELGVERLLINHPQMPFLGWDEALLRRATDVGAYAELSILPDLLADGSQMTAFDLCDLFPTSHLVFGSDLGHAHYPPPEELLTGWFDRLARHVGDGPAGRILTDNGTQLLGLS